MNEIDIRLEPTSVLPVHEVEPLSWEPIDEELDEGVKVCHL
jgi:hypothetical protein